MKTLLDGIRPLKAASLTALALVLAGSALPASAQDNAAEARIRRMESEIRAIQRQVFPGTDGKFFAPEVSPTAPATPGQGATTPVADLLTRMEALEAQIRQLTAQAEQNANRIAKLEAAAGVTGATAAPAAAGAPGTVAAPAAAVAPSAAASPAATASTNLSAMTGGASDANTVTTNTPTPAPTPIAAPAPAAVVAPAPKPAVAPGPSAQRLAAVRAIAKPQSADPGDDEYSYGFRLWEAKFYPEAQQQLKMMIEKYPRHARISFARNLIGRAFLDDGKPREAAGWFLQNYQASKTGDRAPDSLLLLAEAMRQLKDTNRACIALAEFAETYPREAAGRLREQLVATRGGVKCN